MASSTSHRASHEQPHGSPSRVIGDGELAELIRGHDWEHTPLGPISDWSETLITTVNLLLASKHPMFLWWGPELIQFYNDGYRPSIRGDKHPKAVGQRGIECWPEIWPIIGPQIEAVMNDGRSTWNRNQLVPIYRDGNLEEVYWTYSYSPVRDNQGSVQGTLVVCSETTEQVLSERRLQTLVSITVDPAMHLQVAESRQWHAFAQMLARRLDDNPADIPFASLFLLEQGEVVRAGGSAVSRVVNPDSWPLAQAIRDQTPQLIEDLEQRCGVVTCELWPEKVTRAYVLPLSMRGSSLQAVLVCGISPRLPFDERYETFLRLVGARMAGLLQEVVYQLDRAQAEDRFGRLAEANPSGMVIGDLNGRLNYVNPGFLQTLGYSREEIHSGKVRWDDLTPPECKEADALALRQLLACGRCEVYEKAFIAKDGRMVPILLGASIIGRSGGEPEIAAFVTDLTPLKTAEEALRRSNDELEMKVRERTWSLESEIADRKRAEDRLRELTGRLLRTQDEERRRMARDLHDSAGQTLVVLGLKLAELQNAVASVDPRIADMASTAQKYSDDLSQEIRTLSYLLHPPLLDEAGLPSALRWYVEGFSERSKIGVDLDLSGELGRLPKELELVIFRVVQESLTNVHRHSESSSATVSLVRSQHAVEFTISDAGRGITAQRLQELHAARAGVGVRGMEERLRQFGGTLNVSSDSSGTRVTGMLPLL